MHGYVPLRPETAPEMKRRVDCVHPPQIIQIWMAESGATDGRAQRVDTVLLAVTLGSAEKPMGH